MAFKVGAIVSKLTLDLKGWNTAQKKVGADQKTMQGMSDTTAAKFKNVGKAMTVAGGAILATLGAMTKKFVETGDWIDKMSKRTGIGAEALSELAYAADLSGASLTDVEKAVKRMAGSILDASEGLETYARAFRQIGVDVDELMQMNPEEQFLAISEAIASLEDPTMRAAIAQDIFGRAGTALLPMLTDGTEGLAKMRQEARDLGIIFTTETATSAADLKDAQTALAASVKGLSMAFTQHIVPVITEFIGKITATIAKVSEWARENPQLAQTIIKIVAVIGGLLTILGPLVIMLPGLATAFTALTSPIGLVIAGLALLGATALKAGAEFKESMKLYETEMEVTGRKTSWLERTLGSLSATYDKLVLGIDTNRIAQEALNEKMREAQGVMSVLKGTSFVLRDGLGFLKDKFQELNDKMLNTDRDAGTVDTTIRRLATGIGLTSDEAKELIREWEILTDVLDLEVFGELVEVIEEGDIWLENMKLEAMETGDVMADVFKNIGLDYGEMSGVMADQAAATTVEVENSWTEMSQRIKDTWTRELGEMLSGAKSFKDAAGAVWDEIKRMFADMVAQMIVNFAIDGVKELIGGAKKAASGIGSAVEGIGAATAPLAAGIGTLITTLAKAIATAAEIIAASAPAILIAAGVALAIYAGFKIISGLFKKKTGQIEFDKLHELRSIKELIIQTQQHELKWINDNLSAIADYTAARIPIKIDTTNRILEKIRVNTEPIKNMVSAQSGAVITRPTLAALHGSPSNPEIVSPVNRLIERLEGFGGASARASLSQNINVSIMVKDHLDPYSAQEIVRKQIVPNVLRAIEVDSRNKTKMREILGVQV